MRRIHLWLGLSLGLLFVVIGLTGSALVFYVGIDEALHPVARSEPAMPAPGWTSPVWDRALATARASGFDPAGKWSFEVTGEGGAIPARYYPAVAGGGHPVPRQMVWFTADGSRILRVAPWGGYLMSWLYELHMELLAGPVGMQVVGWSGVVLLLLLLTGIVTWWPRGRWSKAIAFKRDAVPLRRLRDLHKLTGVWSAGLLIVLVATGVILALPTVKAALLAPDAVPDPRSSAWASARAGKPISIARALAVARRVMPDTQLAFVDVSGTVDAPLRIRMQVAGDPHRRFPGSYVFVDRYSGRVLAIHDVSKGNIGARINAWVRPLHDGSIGGGSIGGGSSGGRGLIIGMAVRGLVVLIGIMPTLLFVTGLLHWRRRLAARRSSGPVSMTMRPMATPSP
ncbi:PepSY-associated TM helix domain-containing protein [Sphingomonas sp. Leaf17]|uniref:PepSY-associated TM helix domain-containing protein n=1 Tax=Sphingomonas sp. Leaf17 TaxID=1735683 RepID=UPI00138F70E0|nr:PepSY-associated TM helix domain-containing protein [Sphingomonas sp. Leaf17]